MATTQSGGIFKEWQKKRLEAAAKAAAQDFYTEVASKAKTAKDLLALLSSADLKPFLEDIKVNVAPPAPKAAKAANGASTAPRKRKGSAVSINPDQVLNALRILKAFDAEHKVKRKEILAKAGVPDLSPAKWLAVVAELGKKIDHKGEKNAAGYFLKKAP